MEHTGHDWSNATGPLGELSRMHSYQLNLCSALESIADGLPDTADLRLAQCAGVLLEKGFTPYVRFEDEKLFPLLRLRSGNAISNALSQLEGEHVRDQASAIEIAEELECLCRGECRNPEMLGYMLRGFFDGRRSHIGWETTVVIPVARDTLLPQDLGEMSAWISNANWHGVADEWQRRLRDAGCRTARGLVDRRGQ